MKTSAYSISLTVLAVLVTGCDAGRLGPAAPGSGELRAAVGLADSWSFTLTRPNSAVNPSSGDIFETTGSGSFDPVARTIVASGSFTHTTTTGAVVARGTWTAAAFGNFLPFGGPNPGTQGGVLDITVTLSPAGDSPSSGVPMRVTCRVFAPPGFPGEEGTTVGVFTQSTGGATLFHMN